jgi:hypothetical protein
MGPETVIGWLPGPVRRIVGAACAIFGLRRIRRGAVRDRDKDAQLRRARDTVLAHKLREDVEDQIEQDVDLVARARRAGGVRDAAD